MQASDIAVVDVETTGLFPGQHDRVIEVAIVRMTADGTILDEYATLVNPGRDVGRTDIHGIRAGDVLSAPAFSSIVGDLSLRLQGTIVAGHNVTFDVRFLEAELARAGYTLPAVKVLCSMSALGGRLADCCRDYGIELEHAHSALDDARATARLIARWLQEVEPGQTLTSLASDYSGRGVEWPSVAPSGVALRRDVAAAILAANTNYLAGLVSRLPPAAGVRTPTAFGRYYGLLDRVLEDRRVCDVERAEIERLSAEWGLTSGEARDAHVAYVTRLAAQALEDGVVTPAEKRDLADVATALGIEPDVLEALLKRVDRANVSEGQATSSCAYSGRT